MASLIEVQSPGTWIIPEKDETERHVRIEKETRFFMRCLCEIIITSQDNVTSDLYAVDGLEILAHGSSKIYVYGNPEISLKEFNDKAQLIKK